MTRDSSFRGALLREPGTTTLIGHNLWRLV